VAGVTADTPIEEKAALVNQGWQERWRSPADHSKIYLWYGLSQIQIKYAATSGRLATLKQKIEDAGIPNTKFKAFRNMSLDDLDAEAVARGLELIPNEEE